MNSFKQAALALALAACACAAHAEGPFLLPSSTVLAGANQWVTFDAAFGDAFYFEGRGLPLDGLVITAPDGGTVPPQNPNAGRVRSSFDLQLSKAGTYKIALTQTNVFASFKVDGQVKRMRSSPETLKTDIPANATEVQITQMINRAETFVTDGKPSAENLRAGSGIGLEMVPITHPNDLVAGESASFRFLLDGKPAAGQKVAVVPGGTRYRNDAGDIELTADKDGKISFTWPAAGMYYVQARGRDDKATLPGAKERRVGYGATLEVLPK